MGACYGCTHCGKCTTFVDTLHEYCLACGNELEGGLSACPNCGAPVGEGNFCAYCGSQLK